MMLRILPNRYIALLMTPREAAMLEGQILDPKDFPWQDDEANMTAMTARSMIHDAVANMTVHDLDAGLDAITKIAAMKGAVEAKMKITPLCPECNEAEMKFVPESDIWVCPSCGHEAQLQPQSEASEESEVVNKDDTQDE